MKKLIFIGLLATLVFRYDSKTTFKRAGDDIPKIVTDADGMA